MKRFLRILLSYVVSLAALYFSGFGNLVHDVSESLAVTTLFATALIPAAIVLLVWEMHLSLKHKINELSARINKLESKRCTKTDDSE